MSSYQCYGAPWESVTVAGRDNTCYYYILSSDALRHPLHAYMFAKCPYYLVLYMQSVLIM